MRTSSSPRAATAAPRPKSLVRTRKPNTRSAGMIESFVFELDAYWVNGHAAHANASVAPSRGPPNRRPTSASPTSASRSKRIDVDVHRRAACPTCDSSRRPGSPARTRGTRPGRRCRRAGSPSRIGRSTGCGRAPRPSASAGPHFGSVPSCREVPVRICAVHDAVGADDARVADVDHVRCPHVQTDAEAGEEHGRCREQPDRPDGRATRRPVATRDPDAACKEPARAAGRRATSPRRRCRG